MPEVVDKAKHGVAEVRERRPFIDHLVRMQQHYGKAQASQQAGAITYFGFLSFFPILALAFFVIGYVAKLYPDAEQNLVDGISQVLPGLVGNGKDEISLDSIQDAAGTVGLIGLVGVVYSGLGWLSSLRDALILAFETPARDKPNFVVGKLRDLLVLLVIGAVLVVSVGVSSVVTSYSDKLLDAVGLSDTLSPLVSVLSVALGLAASAVLFFAMFELLATPTVPRRPVWQGALFGAIGFEVLKQASRFLLASPKGQPAFQAFGIALILVAYINYFSRIVLYAPRSPSPHRSPGASAASTRTRRSRRRPRCSPRRRPPPSPSRRASGPGAATRGWTSSSTRSTRPTPTDVGDDTAAAVERARADERATLRSKVLAVGSLGGAAALAVVALVKKDKR